MKLEHIPDEKMGHRYVNIDNVDLHTDEGGFEDCYVSISGYCGNINPYTFAAAPELLYALSFVADCLDLGCSKSGREIAVGMARAAIAKAKGITK